MNQYGNGRMKVIEEMIAWASGEIEKIKTADTGGDSHVNANLSGQVSAYARMIQRLKTKKNSMNRKHPAA